MLAVLLFMLFYKLFEKIFQLLTIFPSPASSSAIIVKKNALRMYKNKQTRISLK